ncbi:MAG: PEP-CTERM sorting domain-containing protein [Phycisphaerae bacterium]|nr:PEP-CTERM sorting domain-containing protein [Phycisphaerae bacterium]MCZ2399868.1 PEP-CTERM sorting domain-containing protein [Phycisphaerae bacterium]NUQ50229.1 PEP-CTERM sorting domain-containing protein [Phycisphaerae bacterium]
MRLGIGLICALLVAAPALAQQHDPGLDQKIVLGSFTLSGGQSAEVLVDVGYNFNNVVGYSIKMDYVDNPNSGSWASDMKLDIFPATGPATTRGGYDSSPVNVWDFDGFGSDQTGTYTSGPHYDWPAPGIAKDGIWRFVVKNDWSFSPAVQYNNFSVTLHKIPEPATLSLLALGSLALLRRR